MVHIRLKTIIDESYQDYKKPSMLLATCFCDWKCMECMDNNICQNSHLAKQPIIEINNEQLVARYMNNNLTKAIVFGGLEPMLQFNEIIELITLFRQCTDDDIVIYTGYNEEEIQQYAVELKQFHNIVLKVGRFVPNDDSRFDNVLGVNLVSKNQYGIKL